MWHERGPYQILQNNEHGLDKVGINLEAVRRTIDQASREEHLRQFQNVAMNLIKIQIAPYDAEKRTRRKVRRWKLQDPPDHVARRILANTQTIGRRCKPCVTAMFFRTLWNGRPTTASMRHLPGASGVSTCVLGCSRGAEDRIEHYLVCPVAWSMSSQRKPRGAGLRDTHRSVQAMLVFGCPIWY